MYSTWFHQIQTLSGQNPECLDSLTPEKLKNKLSHNEREEVFYGTSHFISCVSHPDRSLHI